MVRLLQAISVLSKSSPYAVSTERITDENNEFDKIKSYLYIKMPIERDIRDAVGALSHGSKEVIFLCGSSGDGKSEILKKCKSDHGNTVKFHLDATHSFSPNENAIQTLDKLFNTYERGNTPLVVGINTGMLGNYAEEGGNATFKELIGKYLNSGKGTETVQFFNFEDYPKFEINQNGYRAEFAEKILQRVTNKLNNPIWEAYQKDCQRFEDDNSRRIQNNYALLCIPSVQKNIIELLLKARLLRDQFLTARALLDFIFSIVAGPNSLQDNLFDSNDNELANKMVSFDPANNRTKQIDRFILSHDLGIHEQEFKEFKAVTNNYLPITPPNAQSYLRLFYLLRYEDLGNNYHQIFCEDFKDRTLDNYIEMFCLHQCFNDEKEHRLRLRKFYRNTVCSAIRNYNNRAAHKLDKDQYLISEFDGYKMTAKLDIKMDEKALKDERPKSISNFKAQLKVGQEKLSITVNANLLDLMHKINDGYRPNRHDKNTVILIDELNDDISQIANRSETIQILHQEETYKIQFIDAEEFEVSGY